MPTTMTRWIAFALFAAACGKDGGAPKPRADAAPPAQPPVPIDAAPPIDAKPEEPGTRVEGQVKRGDMVIKILKRHGVGGEDAQELIRALTGVLDFKKLQPGQKYVLVHRKGKVLRFELRLTEAATVTAVRGPDGKLVADAE